MSRPAWLAGLVVLGLAAGGCASTASRSPAIASPTPATTASPDRRTPLEKIQAGIPTKSSPAYAYEIDQSDYASSGVIDARHKIAEIVTIEADPHPFRITTMTLLLTPKKTWVKIHVAPAGVRGLPKLPTGWMLIDPQRFRTADGSPYLYGTDESDPGNASTVCTTGGNVTETSPGHFRGQADVGSHDDRSILSEAELKALGKKAYNVQFAAVLDAQGRLTTMSIELPAAGTYPSRVHEIVYNKYGTVTVPKIPTAAEQTKAPAIFYKEFSAT